MIIHEARELAARLGIDRVGSVESLRAGLGGNDLWRLRRAGGDVLLRVFPAGADPVVAEREAAAHRHVARFGIAVPRVLTCAVIDNRPVIAMDWLSGRSVADVLRTGDRSAVDLGRRSGELLARLHRVPLPRESMIIERSWIDWAGNDADRLRTLLDDHDHRLLHLDFHPENLIITDDDRLFLLDWANVRIGPAAADRARTLSILELATIAPGLRDRPPESIMDYRDALLAGYGDPVEPAAPMMAWAYAVQVRDLAGSWVPQDYLDQLRSKINWLLG